MKILAFVAASMVGATTPAIAECGDFSVDVCNGKKVAARDDVVRLSPIDLAAQTHKWDGKTVETTLRCFYADVNEFRCTAHLASMRIDFADLQPTDSRASIERDCDTLLKALSRKCMVTLRFVYSGFNEQETNRSNTITVILAKDNLGTIVSVPR